MPRKEGSGPSRNRLSYGCFRCLVGRGVDFVHDPIVKLGKCNACGKAKAVVSVKDLSPDEVACAKL